MTASRRRTIRAASFVVAALALAGCTADPAPAETPEGFVELPDQPWTAVDEDTTLGSSDEEIPDADGIPQPLHVGSIDPIGSDEVLLVGETWNLEVSSQVIDPATGEATAKFATGPGIWDAVIHPFVGADAEDPAVLAQEVWRPRGTRGAADFTISTYSGNLLEPDEIEMADYTRAHSRWGSSVVTDDGRYFAFWDDALYGIRVYDLEKGEETGALQLLGCGPFTWAVGHDIFSVCEDERQIIQLSIGKDGGIEDAGRAEVLPEDFVSNRYASQAFDAGQSLLVSANGDVFVFDLADGLPSDPVAPIGNAGQDSGRFAQSFINNPATSMVISYTDSAIHPHSVDSGDEVKLILSDPADFTTLATLELAGIGLTSLDAFGYSVDGKTLYVVGSGADESLTIVGFDARTGAETSRAVIDNFTDSPSRLLTPQVIG
ncbi:MAG TPA: hypothetical protein VN035_03570 [Microbacterium sp.]|nr:hypothetical protein [Microbacterium sp.]